ncbi:MAG: DUF4350 domain-containing protein [Thiohalocapsa sp.]|nr:DUF4350 domain-containing protein [Thiohalocapsa sp.]
MKVLGLSPWWLLAAALAVLFAWRGWLWLDNNFERRVQHIETGPSPAARRNAFLAAERYLQRIGVDARGRAGRELLLALPPPTQALIVRGPGPLNAARQAALTDWLQRGGHLVVEAMRTDEGDEAARRDDFLAGLGITLAVDTSLPAGSRVIAEIESAGLARPMRVAFLARWSLRARDERQVTAVLADGRPRLLQYRIGEGLLTVTSDLIFLTNEAIAEHDHALFLGRLVADAEQVRLLHDQALPSLPVLLYRAAPEAMIASAVLLAALLWHMGGRLGPLLPSPARGRRDLLVHLQAAPALIWRLGGGPDQLAAARRRIEHAWIVRHPALATRDPPARAAWIAERAGLPPEDVAAALGAAPARREQDLLARARILQQLRRPR